MKVKVYSLASQTEVHFVNVIDGKVTAIITRDGASIPSFYDVLFVNDAVDDVLHLAEIVEGYAFAAYLGELK